MDANSLIRGLVFPAFSVQGLESADRVDLIYCILVVVVVLRTDRVQGTAPCVWYSVATGVVSSGIATKIPSRLMNSPKFGACFLSPR